MSLVDTLGHAANCSEVPPASCDCASAVVVEAVMFRSRLQRTAAGQPEDFHTRSPIPAARRFYAGVLADTGDRDQEWHQDSLSSTESHLRRHGSLELLEQSWHVVELVVSRAVEVATVAARSSAADEVVTAVFDWVLARVGSLAVPAWARCCTAPGQGLDRTRHSLITLAAAPTRLALVLLIAVVPQQASAQRG